MYPPAGLAEFIFERRWRADPQTGDVVFYAFASRVTEPFGTPHVGIVVDTSRWRTDGLLLAVEGDVDGQVARVSRRRFDTLGFGRPDFRFRPAKGAANMQTGPVFVNPANVGPGRRGRDVMNVQLALAQTVALERHEPAVFDEVTRRAYARWQRLLGHVGRDIDGVPNERTLARLGERSGIFKVRHADEN